ncbi:MAG: SGNH/GDSL hydrolase family protein [Deltaproteobacteria bacterium]|nr:SGNH/GDSL hydrolase family protein [Deltaproteobacteria bacterium]
MTTLFGFLISFIGIAATIEIAARIYFRQHFGIPFRSRMIGEYPYNSFIKMVPSPLHYRFVKGFRSKMVKINRFGCRGPEPAPTGEKKRLLLIGESNFFGVKLHRESEVWDARLQALLRRFGDHNWEIINAGNPTYNSNQHRLYWESEIAAVKPDIVLFCIGFNDLSQAWMMGSKWTSETVWPEKFIMALERKIPFTKHLLGSFCSYLLLRRASSERQGFPRWDEDFKWQRCLSQIDDNYCALNDLGKAQGAQVAIIINSFAYDPEPSPTEARRLEGIQANWHTFFTERGIYDRALVDEIRKISGKLEIPCIDLLGSLAHNPRRHELYFDMAHFNDAGMRVVARTLYHEIEKLGWWKAEKSRAKGQIEQIEQKKET